MNVKDFYYDLPQELIAQDPLEDRSSSRLLVLNKESGEMEHKVFRDILSYLKNISTDHHSKSSFLFKEGRLSGD